MVRTGRSTVSDEKHHLSKDEYEDIVASLSPEFATEVRDLVLTVPDTTPYDKLKTALIG